ncbi:hypothetical protein JW935_28740 [candidate division KSB1 bacterium]|nr:hypothetical protein [candidate division KSB1 bacterium]
MMGKAGRQAGYVLLHLFLLVCFSPGLAQTEYSKKTAPSDTWPGWRGLEKEEVLKKSGIPAIGDTIQSKIFSIPVVGKSYSSPVIANDKVLFCSNRGLVTTIEASNT